MTTSDEKTTNRAPDRAESSAPEGTGPAPHRRNRRAAPRAARTKQTVEQSAQPSSPLPAAESARATGDTAADAGTPQASSARRNSRRAGRVPAPKLVSPPAAAPSEASPPDASGFPLAGTVAPVQPADATPSDVVAAPEPAPSEVAPPKRHRFRFERPAQSAQQFAPRPERLSGAVALSAAAANGIATPSPAGAPATDEPALDGRNEAVGQLTAPPAPESVAEAQPQNHSAPVPEGARVADELSAAAPAGEEVADAASSSAEEGEEASAARRRRRRRRSGIRHLEPVVSLNEDAELPPGEDEVDIYTGAHDAAALPAYGEASQPAQLQGVAQQEAWNVGAAHQQLGQPRSPFSAPEPHTPRGFGSQPQGTAAPFQERAPRAPRSDRGGAEPSSAALVQLGTTLTQAIQQQTDRLLVSMRQTQVPPTMTLALPALPSTERIGVFVDVANLLYSSRSLRVGIDFGRLLEFLRGHRHVVRAHAYAPTNPEPNAEQQFLSVVKGVGYRITTKNFKVFSSGAKKADLDLDLCMDIVRLVDAKAVDTIVLVSGDSDFLPLLDYCSDHGVRVEVAAFEDAAAMILRQSCDLFINLSLVDEIRP